MTRIAGTLDPLPPVHTIHRTDGDLVREVREARGWTRNQLADAIVRSQSRAPVWAVTADTIHRTEAGREAPLWLMDAIAALPPSGTSDASPDLPGEPAFEALQQEETIPADVGGGLDLGETVTTSAEGGGSVASVEVVAPHPVCQAVWGANHCGRRHGHGGLHEARDSGYPPTTWIDHTPATLTPTPSRSDATTLPRWAVRLLRKLVEEAEAVEVAGATRTVVDLDDGDRARLLVALDLSLRGGR